MSINEAIEQYKCVRLKTAPKGQQKRKKKNAQKELDNSDNIEGYTRMALTYRQF
jgi:hypothetical protein